MVAPSSLALPAEERGLALQGTLAPLANASRTAAHELAVEKIGALGQRLFALAAHATDNEGRQVFEFYGLLLARVEALATELPPGAALAHGLRRTSAGAPSLVLAHVYPESDSPPPAHETAMTTTHADPATTKASVVLKFNDAVIRDREQSLNLTDMWKAAGSPENKRPSDWLATPMAREFIEFIGENLNAGKSGIALVDAKRGGTGAGTWAHWQLAMAYAKYLSPAFHAWCNQVVRAHMEGHSAPVPALPLDSPSAELAALRAELAELKAAVLAPRNATSSLPVVGVVDARVYILGPLRQIARKQARLAGERWRSVYKRLDNELREATGYPMVGGASWDMMPRAQLAIAHRKVTRWQREVDARTARMLDSAPPQQLPLKAS